MKNIKYIIFLSISLFFNIFYVNAECTNDEINKLKNNIKDIKITYRYLGIIEEEKDVFDNQFEVVVKNVNEDLFISLFNGTIVLEPSNGEIVSTFNNGNWKFNFYSKKCDKLIDSIDVFIPRFNKYSLDPLCEGIDGDDFPLCGKYYEYDVSYENFKERVNNYRITHNITDNEIEDNDNSYKKINFSEIVNYLVNFVTEYKLYVILSLIIFLIILIVIVVVKKSKKRGVLK